MSCSTEWSPIIYMALGGIITVVVAVWHYGSTPPGGDLPE